jgi:hypothetical protein
MFSPQFATFTPIKRQKVPYAVHSFEVGAKHFRKHFRLVTIIDLYALVDTGVSSFFGLTV